MDPITRQAIAVAGGASGGDPLYVDDVFSTFLYDGTGSTQSINNGIDLSGEGGMVWFKRRDDATDHQLYDTERGATKGLKSNATSAEFTRSGGLTAFNSNGFTVGNWTDENGSGAEPCSWTFRKAPGFFDVVTYSGTGSVQNISHSLGSVPGTILIKMTSDIDNWAVYHRSLGATHYLMLNSTNTALDNATRFNDTEPTASVFTVGTDNSVNQNGKTFVAYLFAHDDQSFGTDSNEAIIKCGSYTGDASGNKDVNVGFEPQWLLIKTTSAAGHSWYMFDSTRGIRTRINTAAGGNYPDSALLANATNAEDNTFNPLQLSPNGFRVTFFGDALNGSGENYIYIAIRRPNKPPTSATEVFKPVTQNSHPATINVGFITDLIFTDRIDNSSNSWWIPRLTNAYMSTDQTSSEGEGTTYFHFDMQNNFRYNSWWGATAPAVNWYFRRAPGFLDILTYDGNLTNRTISHNLGAVPELIIVKIRDSSDDWVVYNKVDGATDYMNFNSNSQASSNSNRWNNTSPTSTVFSVGTDGSVNNVNREYQAFLFASLSGISKIGSYSGNPGYNIDVDCGFTNGARLVIIKRTDGSGDWYAWDTARGIVSGNDPYLILNTASPQVTNTDYIDPLNAGFTVTSSAPAALNASGGTYLFFAIA